MSLTVIIPTLLKDRELLTSLLDNLVDDECIAEILVVKNTSENFEYGNGKVRLIGDGSNIFVNPSWNLGVREAKTEYVALLNDDIRFPKNFCSSVLNLFTENIGVIGADTGFVINTRDKDNNVIVDIKSVDINSGSSQPYLKSITFRPEDFGIAMFFRKQDYIPIPEELKVFFGDDWIIHNMRKNGKSNYVISGLNIYHMGSLSSSSVSDYAAREHRLYVRLVYSALRRLLYMDETCNHYIFYILGIEISINKKYFRKKKAY